MKPEAAGTPLESPELEMPSPVLVTWEAWREPQPGAPARTDLSTLEALRLLNEVRCFGRIPLLLVGHPLRRGDLGLLVEHGARIGLAMRLSPGTDALTIYHAEALRDAGLQRVVLSAEARPHPVLLQEVALARSYGLGVHVVTPVQPGVLPQLAALGGELQQAGVHVWTLSFPTDAGVPMLRGAGLDAALAELPALARRLGLQVEVAGAPQVRRVLDGQPGADLLRVAPADGTGQLHVAADGTLQPSAALGITVGSARQQDVGDAFRDSVVLASLRDPAQLQGKCRFCGFVKDCGGSRARAWAFTGDPLAPDPACGYQPDGAAEPDIAAAAGA